MTTHNQVFPSGKHPGGTVRPAARGFLVHPSGTGNSLARPDSPVPLISYGCHPAALLGAFTGLAMFVGFLVLLCRADWR